MVVPLTRPNEYESINQSIYLPPMMIAVLTGGGGGGGGSFPPPPPLTSVAFDKR